MRTMLIAATLLAGCGDGVDELRYGEAVRYLGDPLGGWYNPDLAGCTLTMDIDDTHRQTIEWDELGRLASQTTAGPDLEEPLVDVITWDGPCLTSWTTATSDGGTHVEEYVCDEQGWPVEYASYRVGADGDVTTHIEYTFENTYRRGRLVERTGNEMTETFRWSGNRLTSYSQRLGDEAQPETLLRYNSAGWFVSAETEGAESVSSDYDGPNRLVSMTIDGTDQLTWVYPDDDARWPVEYAWDGEHGSGSLALAYGCD